MSFGSVLIGIACLGVLVAFLARPFRPAQAVRADRKIEAWVSRVQAERLATGRDLAEEAWSKDVSEQTPDSGGLDDQAVHYCSQCGRRVEDDARFCSGCGARLRRDAR